jgi:hypothetical protein
MNPIDSQSRFPSRFIDIISKNNAGIIALPVDPSVDTVSAATSLYLSLIKMGKNVGLVCSTPIHMELSGVDKVQNQISVNGDNLVISFPYIEGAIDKVDYNIQGENFNLIINPRQGFPKLDIGQVKYTYSGGQFQFVITVDCPNLNSLGEVYTDNQRIFQGKEIINIDRHLTNSYFGTVNIVEKSISSVSELILKLIQDLKIEISQEVATNLYAGIASSTNNFNSYSVNAETFESIAYLLRSGAVKKTLKKVSPQHSVYKPGELKNVRSIEGVEKEVQADSSSQNWPKPKIVRTSGDLS